MNPEDALIRGLRQVCGFESRSVIPNVDWNKVAELATRHAVLPLMAQYLEASVPDGLVPGLNRASLHASSGTIQAKRLVRRMGAAFEAAGVRALLCKGVVLAEWAYGGVTRQVGDIDLLVDPSSYGDAQQALQALGCSPVKVNAHGKADSAEWQSTDGQLVDLRTTLLERYFLTTPKFRELWECRVTISTIDIPTLHPVDHVLFLLLHGFKHQWCRVGWVVDVAMALRQLSSAELAEVALRARQQSVERAVSVGLLLCRELLDPPGISWNKLMLRDDMLVRSVGARYRQRLFQAIPNTAVEKLKNSCIHMVACDRTRQRMRYVLGRASNMLEKVW
jgi:hypothetical protein